MASVGRRQLKRFVTTQIVPRMATYDTLMTKITRKCDKVRSDETWILCPAKKEELNQLIVELERVFNLHTTLLDQWCAIKRELGEEVHWKQLKRMQTGKNDAKFNVWLARRSICADTPDLSQLRAEYNVILQ